MGLNGFIKLAFFFYGFLFQSFIDLEKLVPGSVSVATVRNEVAKVMFLHLCVCPQGGGGLPQCMLGYHPPAGTHQEQAPLLSRRLLLRTIRMLLECILVFYFGFSANMVYLNMVWTATMVLQSARVSSRDELELSLLTMTTLSARLMPARSKSSKL